MGRSLSSIPCSPLPYAFAASRAFAMYTQPSTTFPRVMYTLSFSAMSAGVAGS